MRTLDDTELAALKKRCLDHIDALNERGIPVGGHGEHFILELLYQLVSPRQLAEAEERHFMWLEEELDKGEANLRKQILAMGNGT